MTALSGWLNQKAPPWIVKEGDPRGTAARMVLVALSFVPALGLLAFVAVALLYF